MKQNKDAVSELWRQYEPYIRKLCCYKLKSLPNYIDDCVQDVFLDLSETLSSGKTIEYPKAWLTTVTNNKIKDIYSEAKNTSENSYPSSRKTSITHIRVSFTTNISQLMMNKLRL